MLLLAQYVRVGAIMCTEICTKNRHRISENKAFSIVARCVTATKLVTPGRAMSIAPVVSGKLRQLLHFGKVRDGIDHGSPEKEQS